MYFTIYNKKENKKMAGNLGIYNKDKANEKLAEYQANYNGDKNDLMVVTYFGRI